MIAAGLRDRLRGSPLARNSGWMLLGYGGRLFIQAVFVLIVTRALHAEGYGAFAAGLAAVTVLSPLSGWGSGDILILRMKHDAARVHAAWGNALMMSLATGVVLTAAVTLLAWRVLPSIPLAMVIQLAVAEFFFGRVLEVTAVTFQSIDRTATTAKLNLLLSVARLGAALLFVLLVRQATPAIWASFYLGATVVAGLTALALGVRRIGVPRTDLGQIRRDLRDGFFFSLGTASSKVYNDIDKVMLARFSTLDVTGVYSAGYRLVALALVPAGAILQASNPEFYERGKRGIVDSLALAQRVLPFTAGIGALAGLGLYVGAPIVPHLLGADYSETTPVLHWLALFPLLLALSSTASNTLNGSGNFRGRAIVQVGGAALNIGLNVWLIPAYSWWGAAWATLLTEGSMTVAFWSMIAVKVAAARQERVARAEEYRG